MSFAHGAIRRHSVDVIYILAKPINIRSSYDDDFMMILQKLQSVIFLGILIDKNLSFTSRESCKSRFEDLNMLTLPSIYIYNVCKFVKQHLQNQ